MYFIGREGIKSLTLFWDKYWCPCHLPAPNRKCISMSASTYPHKSQSYAQGQRMPSPKLIWWNEFKHLREVLVSLSPSSSSKMRLLPIENASPAPPLPTDRCHRRLSTMQMLLNPFFSTTPIMFQEKFSIWNTYSASSGLMLSTRSIWIVTVTPLVSDYYIPRKSPSVDVDLPCQ